VVCTTCSPCRGRSRSATTPDASRPAVTAIRYAGPFGPRAARLAPGDRRLSAGPGSYSIGSSSGLGPADVHPTAERSR
jgi:hypothetical protein